jgi:DNA-binding XRE family transcriptional regulator
MKKLLQHNEGVRTDTLLDKIHCDSSELVKEINLMVECRKNLKITQEEMSWNCQVSISTIKRFESFKIDSLSLYMNYKAVFY